MYLLDTDTIIYALKGDQKVTSRLQAAADQPLYLGLPTLMELFYGAYKSGNRTKNVATVRTLAQEFNVIAPDESTAETFGELKSGLESKGNPLDDMDIMIAGTALAKNFILVTNNIKHFRRIKGLQLENWCG
jgi:predicted nucleic acid-binding protein